MPSIEPSTRNHARRLRELRLRRAQGGQAIVLIALMMLVLLGMVGLAVDGGRAYVDRREIQDAVDAAALAAGDNFLNSNSESSAESAASREFAYNMRIGGSEADTSWGTDNASAVWGGFPGSFTITVTHNAFNGTNFTVNATHGLSLAFMQALGVAPTINTAAAARSVVMSQSQTPALLTLSQAGCPGGPTGTSLSIQGSASVALIGALYSNGSIAAQSTTSTVTVAGNAFDNCGGVPSTVQLDCYNPNTNPPSDAGPVSGGCPPGTIAGAAYTGVPPLPDPGYSGASLSGLSLQPNPGTGVVLQPGIYGTDPVFPASTSCYFLAEGVYDWQGGFTANGGLFSNELKPPDEPVVNNLTTRVSPQFWYGTGTNIVHCDGAFEAGSVTSHGSGTHPLNPAGTWGVMITSVRTVTVNGTSYYRESAPSMCRTVSMDGKTTGIQVAISNMPGAQSYNVYASPTGCGGPFGYAQSVINPVVESNAKTSGCPALPPNGNPIVTSSVSAPTAAASGTLPNCSLGYVVSDYIDSTNIGGVGGSNFDVGSSYCPPAGPTNSCLYPIGSPPTPAANDGGEQPAASGAPNQSPLRDIASNGGGDRADEHECRVQTSPNILAPCQGATVTPGAVQFYFPPNACIAIQGSTNSNFGDLFIFGGLQYYGIVLYAPATNTCSLMKLAGGSQTTLIGTVYTPGSNFNIQGGAQTAVQGQCIVGTAVINGTSGTAITYDPGLAPPAPGAKLIL
jgi:Flp pilus assembly protein TadG